MKRNYDRCKFVFQLRYVKFLLTHTVPVCYDAGGDWDEHFLAGLSQDQADTAEEPEDQEDDDLEPPFPKIKTYKEAVSAMEDI